MGDNFNLSKFIRNNPLLNESIGGYKDIQALKEEETNVSHDDDVVGYIKGGELILKNKNGLSPAISLNAKQAMDAVNAGRQIAVGGSFADPNHPNFKYLVSKLAGDSTMEEGSNITDIIPGVFGDDLVRKIYAASKNPKMKDKIKQWWEGQSDDEQDEFYDACKYAKVSYDSFIDNLYPEQA